MSEVSVVREPSGFRVTAVTKLKHAELWKLSKELGSQSELAKRLGVIPSTIGRWILLQEVPSKAMRERIEKPLFDLTGKTIEEIFPLSESDLSLLSAESVIEQTSEIPLFELRGLASQQSDRLEFRFPDLDESPSEAISEALEFLPKRTQTILKMRYGLDGFDQMSYLDIGKALGVSLERVRQIEQMAIRRIRHNEQLSIQKFRSV